MKYKIITFVSKRLYKKKSFENLSKKEMFLFSDYIRNTDIDTFNDILEGEMRDNVLILKNEANALRLEDEQINQYASYVDAIIENRLNGQKLNSDGFYNAPDPIDEGVSLTGYKNEAQRKKMIILASVFAVMSLIMMFLIIYIYSKFNAFY